MSQTEVRVKAEAARRKVWHRRASALSQRIKFCQACGLRAGCRLPVPFSGPYSPPYAVIGEAPGESEEERGRPFVGRAGGLIRNLLTKAELDPDNAFWLNAVSCRPPGNRNPTATELTACRFNVEDQLRLADTKWVLILGGVALSTLLPDAKIGDWRGFPFYAPFDTPYYDLGLRFFPTYHPAYALYTPDAERHISADLERFRGLLGGASWPPDCRRCGKMVYNYDELGVAWCASCWAERPGKQSLPLTG